jgi:tripeptide aminopeptidase
LRPASDAEKARLNETFAALCRIPSPFGSEDAVRDVLIRELEGMRLQTEVDEHGNLLARMRGRSETSLLLCAHMDTVSVTDEIDPVIVDGGWENARDTILGADNKAAVAVILETARRCSIEGAPVSLELLFTVREEDALWGAKQFDVERLRSAFGFVFDHATPIGEVIMASPTYYRIAAEFHGKSAHAGMQPEDGHSAVLAAARAITTMPHGRIDDETTANVGSIRGGVGSTNVVPERCSLLAEARSIDPDKAESVVAQMVDALTDAAADTECDVDLTVEKLFTGTRNKPSAPGVLVGEAALRACGYEPRRIVTGGGSDANAFEADGFHCVNLANGTERPHQPDERCSVAALEGMLDVTFALLDAAAEHFAAQTAA